MNKNIKSNKRDNVLNKTTLGSNLCILTNLIWFMNFYIENFQISVQ